MAALRLALFFTSIACLGWPAVVIVSLIVLIHEGQKCKKKTR